MSFPVRRLAPQPPSPARPKRPAAPLPPQPPPLPPGVRVLHWDQGRGRRYVAVEATERDGSPVVLFQEACATAEQGERIARAWVAAWASDRPPGNNPRIRRLLGCRQ